MCSAGSGRVRPHRPSSRRPARRPSRGSRRRTTSERKLNPSSSRRCVQASTIRAGSTTSVVSPYASFVSTSPGTASYITRRPRGSRRRAGLRPVTFSCSRTMPSIKRFGSGRAPGYVDVDRDDLVHALQGRVVVEHPTRARARAHRDHPLRFEHLVVDLTEWRRHLVHDAARDDEEVGLPGRRTERLHAEPRDVVARRDDRHHLDRAAGEAERIRPHRLRLRPGDGLAGAWSASAGPRARRPPPRTPLGPYRARARARSGDRSRRGACHLLPFQRPLPPDVDVAEREDGDEEQELDEAEPGERWRMIASG